MDVVFYNPKIHEDLLSLPESSAAKAFKLIRLLRTFGSQLRMPYSKQISNNLFELRARGNQEIRIFYCFHQNHAAIVHFFIKKSQKTPKREIETALERISQLTSV